MKCKQARKLIHELMDGALADRTALDEHLEQCADCRAELGALQQIDAAVQGLVGPDVPNEALERLSAGVLPTVAARSVRPAGVSSFRWAAAAAMTAAALVVGMAAGRWLWPRELVVTEVHEVPVVQEKIVEVRVPVVQVEERVVVERVPVVKTQIVYREPEESPAAVLWGSVSEPVKLDPIIVRFSTAPALPAPTLQQEVRPAVLAGDSDDEAPSPTGGGVEPSEDTTTDAGVTEMASARRWPSA